jgi:hypothetical protein
MKKKERKIHFIPNLERHTEQEIIQLTQLRVFEELWSSGKKK